MCTHPLTQFFVLIFSERNTFILLDAFVVIKKTKCLCPSLLFDIHLIINIGGYAATTPGKRYLFLNFTSLACSDENIFGNVHQ